MPLDQDGWSEFKKELHELYKANELGDDDAYTLSHVGSGNPELYPESGYSFGYCQGDIANNEEWQDLFEELIRNPDNGLSSEEMNDIMEKSKIQGDPTILDKYVDKINDILRNSSDKIDDQYDAYLDETIRRVEEVISDAKPEYQKFLNRDEVKKFLCDYHNQYGIDPGGAMEKFLTTGETTVGLADDATPYHTKIDGGIGWANLLDLYFRTSQAQRTPHDPARRFSNLIEQTGLDISALTSIDKAFLFELKYFLGEEMFRKIWGEGDNSGFRKLFQSIFADLSMRNSSPILASIAGFFDLAHGSFWARRDPIVFDLNGDDIQTVSLADSNAYFDLDGDGFREKTEWVSGTDGFLAIDSNENGTIDDITELFGDEDPAFDDGFAKLQTYDGNGDGKIDNADPVFSELKLWQDANENGVTEEGELKDLSDAEIQYIRLNPLDGLSTFAFYNGSRGIVGDQFFSIDQADSIYTGGAGNPLGTIIYELNEQNLFIPWSRGYGNVKDLPVAVIDNPALQGLVSDLKQASDIVDIYNRIDELLAMWAGKSHISEGDMRGAFSARKLAVLEKFMGRDFTMWINGVWSFNAMGRGADLLGQAYDQLKDHVFANIAIQTLFSDTLPEARYDFFNDKIAFPCEDEELIAYLAAKANAASAEERIFLGRIYRSLDAETTITLADVSTHLDEEARILFDNLDRMTLGTTGDDSLSGGDANQVLVGFSGADTLSGGGGGDRLYGGAGGDNLYGGDGSDVVEGGPGDDSISDSNGNDTYGYNPGDGSDTIYDRGTNRSSLYSGMMADGGDDTIRFGEGIEPGNVFFMLEGNNLEITFRNAPTDRITVTNWKKGYDYYSEPYTQIEHIEFSDGTLFEVNDMLSRLGTDGGDTITLTDRPANLLNTGSGDDIVATGKYSDYVNGGPGNDMINAGDGSDVVEGGPGDDTISDSNGNDTYEYNPGDGSDTIYDRGTNRSSLYSGMLADGGDDTIRFGEGIEPGNVFFMLDGYDLQITFQDAPGDRITVTNWKKGYDYYSEPYTQIEHVEFDDGTVFEVGDMLSRLGTDGSDAITLTDGRANFLNTGAGDDTISTGKYSDFVHGGAGDDVISTGNGSDILVGGIGNDTLRGGGHNDVYVYNAGDGIDNIYDRGTNKYGSIATGGIDTLRFGDGINAGDVHLALEGYNLIAAFIGNPSDEITMINWKRTYDYGSYPYTRIENIEFSDGTVFPIADVYSWRMGSEGNDTIQGGGRVDYINAGGGDDVLIGGSGNDFLVGGAGSDIYRFARGFGRDIINNDDEGAGRVDVIEFAQDIDAAEVNASRVGDDLLLASAATGDTVTVKNHYFQDGENTHAIDEVRFLADGVAWSFETLKIKALEGTPGDDNLTGFATDDRIDGLGGNDILYGADGADTIIGGDGNDHIQGGAGSDYLEGGAGEDLIEGGSDDDILIGGAGNDVLSGGFGDDTYVLRPGADLDTFSDPGGNDTLRLEGTLPEDVLIHIDQDNVVVTLSEGASAVLTHWSTVENRIENIVFDDGQEYGIEAFLLPQVTSYELTLDEDTAADGTIEVNGGYGGNRYDVLQESAHGDFTLNQDGSWHYRPDDQYFGTDQVKVSVENDFGGSAVSTIRFYIEAVNDAPAAADDAFSVDEDNFLVVAAPGLLENDIDVDGDDLLVDSTPVTLPENGTLLVNADGSFSYTPNENFNGSDSFTYTVNDGSGLFDTGRVEIVVQPVNDAPVIENLPAAPHILQDVRTVAGLMTAADVDGDTLVFSVKEGPANGTLDIDEIGNWLYTAGDLFMGEDLAVVEVSDGNGGTAQAWLNFDVRVSPPDIENQTILLLEDSDAAGRIDAVNPIGGALALSIGRPAASGNFVLNADNTFSYAPNPDYNGTDSVMVTAANDYGLSDSAVLTFDIEPVNDAPMAPEVLQYVLFAAADQSGSVPAEDVDGDTLAFAAVVAPSHGTFDIDGEGRWIYTPEADFAGEDQVRVQVSDGNGGSAETELLFKVNVFEGGTAVVGEGGIGTILMDGISKDDLTLARTQDDLFITVRNKGSITLAGYFTAPENGVKQLSTLEGPLYLDKDRIAGTDCGCWWKRWREKFNRLGVKNLIYGSSKSETLFGANENDVLFGADGNDGLYGKSGNDTLVGGSGKDHLWGWDGDDTLYGDQGRDFLFGDSGDDVLIGGAGADRLDGGSGNDWLFGDEGDDRIDGGRGDDILVGGAGEDILDGGRGDDIYRFGPGDGKDQVYDRDGGWCWWKKDSGHDTVRFDEGVSRESVAVFMRHQDLYLLYGDEDMVRVDQQRHRRGGIERFELADGSYLTDADINGIVQQMAAYAVKEGLCLHSVQDVRNNEELMTLIAGSWNAA